MKVTMKLIAVVLFCTIIGVGQSFAGGNQQSSQKAKVTRLSIAGGPSGGAYYAVSLGMADLLMKKIEGMNVDVVTTAGAVENPLLIGQGENDFGITTGETALAAYEGTDAFAGRKQSDLRILFSGVAGGYWHLVTNARMTSIDQLKGKHIAMGPEGNISPVISMLVFKQYGIGAGDFTPSYLAFEDGMSALSDGQVDAAVATGAVPLSAVQELAANINFNYKIQPLSKSVADAIVAENPVYGTTIIRKGTYNRQNEDVLTIGTTNFMVTNAKVPDDVVYQVVKAIFENLETLQQSHPSAKEITLQGAAVDLIPIHEGAKRYYREMGIIK